MEMQCNPMLKTVNLLGRAIRITNNSSCFEGEAFYISPNVVIIKLTFHPNSTLSEYQVINVSDYKDFKIEVIDQADDKSSLLGE